MRRRTRSPGWSKTLTWRGREGTSLDHCWGTGSGLGLLGLPLG